MAPTKRKLENTNVWEEVLVLVMPYIHNGEDQTSVSLVSRRFYELDRITRKRVTVHAYYYLNPASLSERFPFLEALTLKGPPYIFNDRGGYAVRVTPWIEELELEDSCLNLKELDIRGLVVNDEDLKILAQTRGMSLGIVNFVGFRSVDGDRVEMLVDVAVEAAPLVSLVVIRELAEIFELV
ncbi:coronatine insensitive 1 [Artemisia annua]|uniref:Coronatine insensitive 1 n=1 Tax=Artemisia annua TaxID=35608 RepID=A0A2U1NYU2_ARTAN|nr:coronatine insensitive 1 [Artemisia annua]